jgi:uncharacterized protein (DUF1778 family)
MPNKHPRIALTIPQEYKSVYDDTAALMGIPTSKFILNMLIEASPSIKALQRPLKKAQADRSSVLHDMTLIVDEVRSEVDKAQIDIEDLIENTK